MLSVRMRNAQRFSSCSRSIPRATLAPSVYGLVVDARRNTSAWVEMLAWLRMRSSCHAERKDEKRAAILVLQSKHPYCTLALSGYGLDLDVRRNTACDISAWVGMLRLRRRT